MLNRRIRDQASSARLRREHEGGCNPIRKFTHNNEHVMALKESGWVAHENYPSVSPKYQGPIEVYSTLQYRVVNIRKKKTHRTPKDILR